MLLDGNVLQTRSKNLPQMSIKIDGFLLVAGTLSKVAETLSKVVGTLSKVAGTLSKVAGTLHKVGHQLRGLRINRGAWADRRQGAIHPNRITLFTEK